MVPRVQIAAPFESSQIEAIRQDRMQVGSIDGFSRFHSNLLPQRRKRVITGSVQLENSGNNTGVFRIDFDGDVKKRISGFQRKGLVDLIRDLYESSKENRTFLHARFGDGEDVLEPYKKSLQRWLRPDERNRGHP